MIEELLGKVTFDKLLALLDNIVSSDIENSLKLIDEIYEKGSEPRNLCENFLEFLRNVIIILNAKNPLDVIKFTSLSSVDVNKVLEKKYNPKLCQKILDTVIEYYREVKFATNPYLWVELTVISASRAKEILTVQPVKEIIQTKESMPQTQSFRAAPSPEPVKSLGAASPVENSPTINNTKNETQLVNTSVPDEKIQTEKLQDTSNVEQTQQSNKSAASDNQDNGITKTENNVGNLVEIWSNIVNSIESVPAKFFYSGMAKLVELDENRIILGFINHNVITQAKSELKHKALIEAEQKVYGGKYSFEFVQLGGNIKPLEGADVKPVIKQQPKTPQAAQQKPQGSSFDAQSANDDISPKGTELQKSAADGENANSSRETDEENNLNQALYSPKVKEMLEAFGGKIIE